MVVETVTGQYAFLLGRLLFGGILAFMGLNHFLNTESLSSYAEAKGVPAPRLAVLGSGTLLVLGSLSIAAGIYPIAGSLFIILFLLPVTFEMHDFWNLDDPQQKQTQMSNFLKNMALLGGALVFAALALDGGSWPYAVQLLL